MTTRFAFMAATVFTRIRATAPLTSSLPLGYAPCLNVNKFVNTLLKKAARQSHGNCGKAVGYALEQGGINTQGHPTDPKDYGPFLLQNGFSGTERQL